MQIIRGSQADFLMLGEYLKQRLIHFLIKLNWMRTNPGFVLRELMRFAGLLPLYFGSGP